MRLQELIECSGYIPKNEKEAKDPRWSRALSVDVGIHTMEQQLADIFPSKPIGSRRLQQITESLLITDVPNEDWLEGKVERAKERGYDSYNSPYFGTTTAYVRQPSHVNIPVDILKRIPGARQEQQKVRHNDLEAIMKIMDETGKLPLGDNGKEYLPFIGVAWNGEARVLEGNHRIMAAAKLGWTSLPIELKYFDGGERVKSGILYPEKIGLKEPEPGATIITNQD